ncbi:MAG: hypothetical protein O7A09_06665, partial [Proteobacteria bacterium]|nr:hypothetical protein [Pseudomonadota bacterium]
REIEEGRAEARAAAEEAAQQGTRKPRFGVRADVFRDSNEATAMLTQLLDSGYDGTLVSGETAGIVLFEIHVGPYLSLEEAESVSNVLRRSFELQPTVMVFGDDAP